MVARAVAPTATALRLGLGQNDGQYDYSLTNWDFAVSGFTNCVAVLPVAFASMARTSGFGSNCFWYSQWVSTNNVLSGATGMQAAPPPFYDGRVQLKQNLRFLLRAATTDLSFQFIEVLDTNNPDMYNIITTPTNYAYADFYQLDEMYWTAEADLRVFQPFTNNCLYRNFVFDPTELDCTGRITTGAGGNYWDNLVNGHYYPGGLMLVYPPLYQTNGVGGALLGINDTQWLSSYALDSWYYLVNICEIGLTADWPPTDDFPTFYLSNNACNLFGLPFLSVKMAWYGDSATLYPGSSLMPPNNAVYFYPQTAQPQFQTVGYDFWRRNVYWLPGHPNFSPTNTPPLLMDSVGYLNFAVAGYAKLAVTNSYYSGVYGYLGQYFTNAYKIDTNGIVTTNTTGLLSPYGDFFATEPGPVALRTMPDIETGERGTGIVNVISMAFDRNGDGVMDLSIFGPDNTSQYRPYVFWVNSGYTQPGGGGNLDQDMEVLPPHNPNYTYGEIRCQRNLENFARLWLCGLPALSAAQGYAITLSWQNTNGVPAINLYQSVESDGGTSYLTDTNTAAFQCFVNVVPGVMTNGPGVQLGTVAPGAPFVFAGDFFAQAGNKYLLFEGAGIGSGELVLTIWQGTNVLAKTSQWLDLHDIKDFYEQAHTTNIDNGPPSTKTSVLVEDNFWPADSSEDQQVIVFVHGLNVSQWEYCNDAETMFKRLYWQGYHGRFAAFRWPSPVFAAIPTGNDQISYFGFNNGEYISWHSGAALKAYIDDLHNRLPGYTINLAVHSLGNVAANEAIREGAVVDNYVLMQAAISAGAFDGTNSALIYDYLASTANSSPDANALGGYNNCFTNATRRVNFYNDDDFALYQGIVGGIMTHTWEGNQLDCRPDHIAYPGGIYYRYSFDGTNCIYGQYDNSGNLLSGRTLTDDFEKKAYVARSRTKAVGAAGLKYEPFALTGGAITNNISLQDAKLRICWWRCFWSTRPEHSGEFTKTIQNAAPFYKELLKDGFLIIPNP